MAEYSAAIVHINDLQIGAVFDRGFDFGNSFPLAGKQLKMQVKKSWDNPNVLMTFSLSDNSITVSGTVVTLKKNSSETNIMPGTYYYDLFAYTNADDAQRIMKGTLTADFKVTDYNV